MVKEQLRVLYALDVAKTQWYHFIAVMIAGMGFFTYAYDIICISLVTKLLGRLYYHVDGSLKPGTLPPNVSAAVNGFTFCGTVFGQLFFGWLGDKLGRKRVYGITLRIMMFCSIGSGLSFGRTAKSIMTTLCFFRFWFGFAVGSTYPLSATIISEYSNRKTRGAFIAAVFAMQGFGILAGGIFSIFISLALKPKINTPSYEINPIGSTVPQADYIWRIILMAGALPACFTYYWRKKLPETPRYTALVARNAKQVARDMSKVLHVDIEAEPQKVEQVFQDTKLYGLFSKEFLRRHGKHLLGTTSCWLILEVVFYSQYLNQKNVYSAIGWIPPPEKMNAIEEVIRIAKAKMLIASCSTIPGYWFTVAFIDKMGRITIQLMGFFFTTVLTLVLALPRHYWAQKDHHISFFMLYSLMFFFVNFGPNVTTFVIPAEIFPSRFRSTCHGISSASGKLGAFVGALAFIKVPEGLNKAKVDVGMRNSLFLLAGLSFLGMLCTFLLPEPKGKSLEEISGENEDGTIGSSFEKSSHIVKVPFT